MFVNEYTSTTQYVVSKLLRNGHSATIASNDRHLRFRGQPIMWSNGDLLWSELSRTTSIQIKMKKKFDYPKCISKCSVQNVHHFVPACVS